MTTVPPGFEVAASIDSVPIVAMADEARRWYGVQFHPEVTHTHQGVAPLRRCVVESSPRHDPGG